MKCWSIERVRTPENCGVVTSGYGAYFPGVQLLYCSLVWTHENLEMLLWEIPDCPLTAQQRDWCERQPRLRVEKLTECVVPTYWRPAWQKPAMIRHSPFERTLWLDADCLVLRSLLPVLEHIQQHPLFLTPNTIYTPNHPQLAAQLGITDRKELFTLNTAIVGYHQGREDHRKLVERWCELTRRIGSHPDHLEKYVSNADEGVLRTVLQLESQTHIVWPDLHWAWPVWHGHDYRQGSLEDTNNLLSRWPHEYVVHFLGQPKIWAPSELLDIEPHRI
jgi:hypothetical protein